MLSRELKRAARVRWTALKEAVQPPRGDGLPLPPPRMRDKVVKGIFTADGFLTEGAAVAQVLQEAVRSLDKPVWTASKVYEWGCGCGRVARHFMQLGAGVSGSDIDPELVAWCQKHLSGGRFELNGYTPPLEAPSDTFDLVYSISVMTHITQEAADAWIRELARIAKPEGVIAISLLARKLPSGVHYDERSDLGMKRSWLGVGGAPAVYLNTWHDIDWLADRWREVVRLERHLPKAIRGRQDLLLFGPV